MPIDTSNLIAEVLELKRRLRNLEEILQTMIPKGGGTPSIHGGVDADGRVYAWDTFFQGGKSTREEYQVEKLCLRLGSDGAHARDRVDKTGPIGMSIGVSGEAISHYDYIPQGVTVVLEEDS